MKLILLIIIIILENCINLQELLSSQAQISKSISVFDIIDSSNDQKGQVSQGTRNLITTSNYKQIRSNSINPNISLLRNRKTQLLKSVNVPYKQSLQKRPQSLPIDQILEKLKAQVSNPLLKTNFTLPNIANFFANFISGNELLNKIQVNNLAKLNDVDISDILNVKQTARINNLEITHLISPVLNITDNGIEIDPEVKIKMKNSRISFKAKDIFEVIAFMKYILKICGSRLEKCDFRNLLTLNKTEEILNVMKFMTLPNINLKNTSSTENASNKNVSLPSQSISKAIPSKVEKPSKKNLRKSEFKFRQSNLKDKLVNEMDFDKEINYAINHYNEPKMNNIENDYSNLLDTPDIQKYMNDYYYTSRIIHINVEGEEIKNDGY